MEREDVSMMQRLSGELNRHACRTPKPKNPQYPMRRIK